MIYIRSILQASFLALLFISVTYKIDHNHVEALYTLVLAISVMQCLSFFKGLE